MSSSSLYCSPPGGALVVMYKNLLLVVLLSVLPFFAFAQQDDSDLPASRNANEWNDISVFEQNRLYPRVNVVPYDDENDIEHLAFRRSSSYLPLEDWRVSYTSDFVDRVDEFENVKGFSAASWQYVELPDARWMHNGKPLKRLKVDNVSSLPTKGNATASYFTEFEVDKEWEPYDVFLQLQPLSACHVWVNHEYVGYTEDSRSLAEFDITKHIKIGKVNNIILQLVSLSTSSLLESNLLPSSLGFGNEVALCLKNAVNVRDFAIHADAQGSFSIDIDVSNRYRKGRYYIEVELWDPNGKRCEKMGKWIFFDKRSELSVSMDRDLPDVRLWSAEVPNLYTAVIRLLDEKMQVVESVGSRFGFRSVVVEGDKILFNGAPFKLNGVVFVDYPLADNGVQNYAYLEECVQQMKRCNVNAVRTAVFSPANDYFYNLCDKYGIYVICDANLCPYSTQSKAVATDKNFSNMFLSRVQNMYEQLKNHPSIIMWSLGESPDNGVCMMASYKQLKQKDRSRPVIFSGAGYSENTDVIALSNASRDNVRQYLSRQQSRPLLLFSFGSTTGNSLGSLSPLWCLVQSNSSVYGGFLNCWNDYTSLNLSGQTVSRQGLFSSSRQLQPAATQIKSFYNSFSLSLRTFSVDAGEFSFSNNSSFLSAADYVLEYNVYTNLKPSIVSGDVSALPSAGGSKAFKLKLPRLTLYAGEELFIRFSVRLKHAVGAMPKGTLLYEQQFIVPMDRIGRQPLPDYGRHSLSMHVDYSADTLHRPLSLGVTGSFGSVQVDLVSGELQKYVFHGKSLLSSPLALNFWRLPTPNDESSNTVARQWRQFTPASLRRQLSDIAFSQPDSFTVSVDMMVRYTNEAGVTLMDVRQTMLILHTGDIVLNNSIMTSDAVKSMPRIGMQVAVDKSLSSVQWMGPEYESYPDRYDAAHYGLYKKPAASLSFRYAKPQEAGSRYGSRWVSLHNDNVGLFFDMIDSSFSFSVYPFSDNSLARSSSYPKEDDFWTINLDHRLSGIGSALSGTDIDERCIVFDHKTSFAVHLCGFDMNEYDPVDFTRVALPIPSSNVLDMPVISRSSDRFNAPLTISLSSPDTAVAIYYTLDGSDPSESSSLYTAPFVIENSTTIKARAFSVGCAPSFTAMLRCDYDYVVSSTFDRKPNTPYNHNAANALFDGETGQVADLSQGWLGFSGGDCGVTLQLSKPVNVDKVSLRFAHNPDAWIFAPVDVVVFFSYDGSTFADSAAAIITFRPADKEQAVSSLQLVDVKAERRAVKAVRVLARGIGRIPEWHRAKGLKPWLLTDEIVIKEME